MSGRGSNRGGGFNRRQGGRDGFKGRGRGGKPNRSSSNGNQPNTNQGSKKKSIDDIIFSVGNPQKQSEFPVNLDFIINHVRKEFGSEIAKSLEDRTEYVFDPPQMEVSNSSDPAIQKIETRQFEIMYQSLADAYVSRVGEYKKQKAQVYALIWGRCSTTLQGKIRGMENFEQDIKEQPIELIKAIEQLSINYTAKVFPYISAADAHYNLLTLRQKDEESLTDYYNRFKSARDIVLNQLGPLSIIRLAEREPGYTTGRPGIPANPGDPKAVPPVEPIPAVPAIPSNVREYTKASHDQYLAILFLKGAHHLKYGSLLKNLATSYSLGQEQYPRTLADAFGVLERHPFDATFKEHMNRKKNQQSNSNRSNNNHSNNNNSQNRASTQADEPVELSFAQMENRCFCCGKKGHYSNKCPDKNKPKDKWAMAGTKELQGVQQMMDAQSITGAESPPVAPPPSSNNSGGDPSVASWLGHQMGYQQGHQFAQSITDMKEWILLDSQSTVNLFCNPRYVNNIRKAHATLQLSTNTGQKAITTVADVPDYGTVWFDNESITNIFSLADMSDKYRVTFDSATEQAFIVHASKGPVRFVRVTSNLYAFIPPYASLEARQ